MMQRVSVLIIEDEKSICDFISKILGTNDYKVTSAPTGKEGLEVLTSLMPDIILLDLGLPDMDGLEIIRSTRKWSSIPIIVISARTQEKEKVLALDAGADDYITKPFSVNVLTSKVNAFMRRLGDKDDDIYVSGDIEVSMKDMQVKKSGELIPLSKTELQLLIYLLENAGHILSRECILQFIWGNNGQFVDDNTVTVNISRLKNKMHTENIENVRGLGYIWTEKVSRK